MTNSWEIELKKCPFCGEEAKLHVDERGVKAMCTSCKCQSPQVKDVSDSYAAVYMVVDFWNRRLKE